jgi:hypothetical protein
MNTHRWVTALLLLVAACSSSDAGEPATSTTEPTAASSTTLETAVPTTPVSTSTAPTVPASTSTVPASTLPASTVPDTVAPGPLEFVDGTFLGISQGTLMTDAAAALSASPVALSDLDPSVTVFACTGTPDPAVIQSGGLTLVFESWEGTPAVLTNWMYVGGPVGRFTEMVAPHDLRIGDSRDQVVAAYPDFMDLGNEIAVFDPTLRFAFEDGVIAWFGIIDCVFEGSEPAD